MSEIKVLIADDSGLMRLIISDILKSVDGITVVGTANDGKEAVAKVKTLQPDVLILDMYMGEYDGIYAVRNILKDRNLPIIILSSIGNTNLDPIMEALNLGAFDYLNKPKDNNARIREVGAILVKKIQSAYAEGNKRVVANRIQVKSNQNIHTFGDLNFDVIVIGASTGGPSALENVILGLPSNIPVPILIAQHMPANFVHSFVDRINKITPLNVKIGKKGDLVLPGTVVIAPGDHNMSLRKGLHGIEIDYDPKVYKEFDKPSVDALFLSAAKVYKEKTIAVVLTGMGKDGADGASKISEQGGFVFVQNKETSTVFGMPKAVVDKGVARNQVPLNQISGFLVSCLA